jgi:hypothetical protein
MIKLKQLIFEIEGTEPHTYYHITFDRHLKKIKRYGLKAREKAEWTGMFGQDIREKRGVFVFDNYYDALMWAFKTSWAKKGEKIWILKIRTNDTDFEPDTHWEASGSLGKWLVKKSTIPADQIVEYIPFDIAKWNPELTKKINDLKSKRYGL